MYSLRCTLEEAFDRLLKQNGTIAPNFHFMEVGNAWRNLKIVSFSGFNLLGTRIVRLQLHAISSWHSPALAIASPPSTPFALAQGQITNTGTKISFRLQPNWHWGTNCRGAMNKERNQRQTTEWSSQKVPRYCANLPINFFPPYSYPTQSWPMQIRMSIFLSFHKTIHLQFFISTTNNS